MALSDHLDFFQEISVTLERNVLKYQEKISELIDQDNLDDVELSLVEVVDSNSECDVCYIPDLLHAKRSVIQLNFVIIQQRLLR